MGEGGRGWAVLAGSVHMPRGGLSRTSASQWALQLWQWPGNGFFLGGGGGMRRGGGMHWLCYYFLDALVNIDLHPFNFAALLYSYLNWQFNPYDFTVLFFSPRIKYRLSPLSLCFVSHWISTEELLRFECISIYSILYIISINISPPNYFYYLKPRSNYTLSLI